MIKGTCSLAYILGTNKKGHDERDPILLAGNPERAQRLIDGLASVNPFTSLVLSYEREITRAEAERDITSFEKALFPGLDDAEWERVWVMHREHEKDPTTKKPIKDGRTRTGLHCVIPNVHLHTGKIIKPYWDKIDRKRLNIWRDLTNLTHNYASPNDPARARPFKLDNNLPPKVAGLKVAIFQNIFSAINNGEVLSLEDRCTYLVKHGFKIERTTKNFISISHPDLKRHIRLKGKIYEPRNTDSTVEPRHIDQDPNLGRRGKSREELERELAERCERKSRELDKLFHRDRQPLIPPPMAGSHRSHHPVPAHGPYHPSDFAQYQNPLYINTNAEVAGIRFRDLGDNRPEDPSQENRQQPLPQTSNIKPIILNHGNSIKHSAFDLLGAEAAKSHPPVGATPRQAKQNLGKLIAGLGYKIDSLIRLIEQNSGALRERYWNKINRILNSQFSELEDEKHIRKRAAERERAREGGFDMD